MNFMEKMLSAKPFKCPNCGQELPLADVNVAQDVALCRACNYTGSFLAAATVPRLTDEELARPPKRVSLQREFGDALTITCRPKRTSLWFLVPFTALWSGGSMAGIYGTQIASGNFDLKLCLFGLPFLAGTVVLATIILYLLFGKTTVTIEKSGYRVNDVQQPEIVLTSGEKKLKFGALGMPNEVQTYVAAVLRRAAGGG